MMSKIEFDLLEIDRGTITAPAGCGKTQLIVDALKRHKGTKPVLILTHTNAGVSALRSRLNRSNVPATAYRLATIDGWSMRLVSTFPTLSKTNGDVSNATAIDYPAVRKAAANLIKIENLGAIIRASYARLLVDEYQDCSTMQHAIIYLIAKILPVCVLGDPLQAIFGFGSNELADWEGHVCKHFPLKGELRSPWRWTNAGAESLGHWLLKTRENLLNGKEIDLSSAPKEVTWIKLDGTQSDHEKSLVAARTKPPTKDGSVLIIGDSRNPNSRFQIASSVAGAVTVEAVDMRDLISFARGLNILEREALKHIANFAQSIMSNVGPEDLVRRVKTIMDGRARNPATEVETAAIAFTTTPSYERVANLLVEIARQGGVRTFRPAVMKLCLRALQLSQNNPDLSFEDATIQMREQNRLLGRSLPKRAVGSTLLLKGLEADAVVILNAESLDSRNLYVAMTRGSKSLTICSKSARLNPVS